jgi:hypothetical protein
MDAPVHLQEPAVVAAELEALAAAGSLPANFCAGARAALLWATQGGCGPLTGTMTPPQPAMRAIVAELSAAEAIIYGRPSPLRDFAVGVEHALLWVERATPTPPSVRSMPACAGWETASDPRGPGSRGGRRRGGIAATDVRASGPTGRSRLA